MRAFLAVDVSEPSRSAVAALQRRLSSTKASVVWVAPPNLHLTLAFLGDIDEAVRNALEPRLAEVAAVLPPWTASLGDIGAFPNFRNPQVLWIGLARGSERLITLAQAIHTVVAHAGVSPESREFVPHLTFGRVRANGARMQPHLEEAQGAWRVPQEWTVSSFRLYQSRLSSAGPTYSVLRDFAFTRADGA